jgi:hypothetical protein
MRHSVKQVFCVVFYALAALFVVIGLAKALPVLVGIGRLDEAHASRAMFYAVGEVRLL